MSDIFLAIKQLRDLLEQIEQFKNAQRSEIGLAMIDVRRCALRSDFEKCIFEMLAIRPDGVTITEWVRVLRIAERFGFGQLAGELTSEVCRAFRDEADPILFAISQRARALVVPSVTPTEADELPDRAPEDGPFEPLGFRFRGRAIQFHRSHRMFDLTKSLWDGLRGVPRQSRFETDVTNEIGSDDLVSLCKRLRSAFAESGIPLEIIRSGGRIWIEVKEG